MAIGGRQLEPVDPLQVLNGLQLFLVEGRRLALEGVEADALQEVTEGDVQELREALQDLHDALLHAHPGLDAFDGGSLGHGYHGTHVPQYRSRAAVDSLAPFLRRRASLGPG